MYVHNYACFLVAKLIRTNLFSFSEKMFKLTYSNVEIKKMSESKTPASKRGQGNEGGERREVGGGMGQSLKEGGER